MRGIRGAWTPPIPPIPLSLLHTYPYFIRPLFLLLSSPVRAILCLRAADIGSTVEQIGNIMTTLGTEQTEDGIRLTHARPNRDAGCFAGYIYPIVKPAVPILWFFCAAHQSMAMGPVRHTIEAAQFDATAFWADIYYLDRTMIDE